jgi:hypothetical protein
VSLPARYQFGFGKAKVAVIALVLTRLTCAPVVSDYRAVASAPDMRRCLNLSNLRIVSVGAPVQRRSDSSSRRGAIRSTQIKCEIKANLEMRTDTQHNI